MSSETVSQHVLPKLIGIAGPARSGKDTIANTLSVGWGYRRYSFADPIRDMLRAMLRDPMFPDSYDKEEPLPQLGVSPRELMQTLGTEWGRDLIRVDLWRIIAQQRMLFGGSDTRWVIPDVRFENEAAFVREHGELWHVVRPGVAPVREHVSENPVSTLPNELVVHNNRTESKLVERVHALMHWRTLPENTPQENTPQENTPQENCA